MCDINAATCHGGMRLPQAKAGTSALMCLFNDINSVKVNVERSQRSVSKGYRPSGTSRGCSKSERILARVEFSRSIASRRHETWVESRPW